MNFHKRVAAMLATSMLFTVAPIMTYGTSMNYLQRAVLRVPENHVCKDITTANALRVKFSDHDTKSPSEIFYLELNNAKWDSEALSELFSYSEFEKAWYFGSDDGLGGSTGVKYEMQSHSLMKVTVFAVNPNGYYTFPLITKITGQQASVRLDASEGGTTASEGTYTFATVVEGHGSLLVTDTLPTFYNEGYLAPLKFTESYVGAMLTDTTIDLSLTSNEYEFDFKNLKPVTCEYSLEGYRTYLWEGDNIEFLDGFTKNKFPVYLRMKENHGGEVKVIIPGLTIPRTTTSSAGTIKLKNIGVKSTKKMPNEGTLGVNIKSNDLTNDVKNLSLATIRRYGSYIEMRDKVPTSIVAGQTGEIIFVIGENIPDSLIGGREAHVQLSDGAAFDYRYLLQKYGEKAVTKTDLDALTDEEVKSLSPNLDAEKLKGLKLIQEQTNGNMIESVCFAQDESGSILENELIFTFNKDLQSNDLIDKVTLAMPVYVPITSKDKNTIWMTLSGRAVDGSSSTAALSIKSPFKVEPTPTHIKVGLQNQFGGSLKVIETNAKMLKRGGLNFKLVNIPKGISFSDNATVAIVGDIDRFRLRSQRQEEDTFLESSIKLLSNEMSTLEFNFGDITADRTISEGKYDLEMSGETIDVYGASLIIEDFFIVDTPNTYDIEIKGLDESEVIFTISSKKCLKDKRELYFDAAPYLEEPGYTMVPVRNVVKAFGIADEHLVFDEERVTLFANNKTIQLTSSSALALVDGTQIPMGAPVTIKEGRTYIPIADIARLLDLKVEWNAAMKTITFTKQKTVGAQ